MTLRASFQRQVQPVHRLLDAGKAWRTLTPFRARLGIEALPGLRLLTLHGAIRAPD